MASMITRYCVMDEVGRKMTVHGEFSNDEDYEDAFCAEFSDEDEALECAIELVGSIRGLTIERYQRFSPSHEPMNYTEDARTAA